jgi:LytS/YehU family sensor histidine kinase
VLFGLLSSWFLEPILDTCFSSYFFISYLSQANVLLVFTIFLVASTLIKLAEDWFYFNTNENRILKQKNLQIETQLSALRAQINPHFLFNSLNVIYALALEKKEGITKAIVQLSDILRYVIYDADTEQVSLKDELQLLNNYIAFQNHRINVPDMTVVEADIADEQYSIYPMLLLPLLENAYKHGIDNQDNAEPIRLKLWQSGLDFKFTISNTIRHNQNQLEDKHSGVGLENIRNNLNLVYPNRHDFKISQSDTIFKVSLSIRHDKP